MRTDDTRAFLAACFERADQRRDRVAEMTRAGRSAAEIAVVLGISKRHVARIRVEIGIAQEYTARPLTEGERVMAAQLLADGCSYAETARTVGRHVSTITHHFPGRGWSRLEAGQFASYVRHMGAIA